MRGLGRAMCAGLLGLTSVAGGQLSTPTLDQLVAQLRSDSFAERNAATDAIAAGTNFDTADLVRTLNSGTLDAESTQRLTEALRRRFFASTRGALGISMQRGRADEANAVGAPRVVTVVDALPAGRAGLLRVGDEIIEIEGESIENRVDPPGTRRLQIAVFSRQPGESIRAKIRRPLAPPHIDEAGNLAPDAAAASEIIETVIPLGRFDVAQAASMQPVERNPNAPRGMGDLPVIIVEPEPRPGQIAVQRGFMPRTDQLSAPMADVLADAWLAFARRAGIAIEGDLLNANTPEPLVWDGAGTGVALGRQIVRPGGRVLSGPIAMGRGLAALLREQADIERNQMIRRNLAVEGNVAVPVEALNRNPDPRIVRFGEGANRIEFRVIGDPNAVVAGSRVRSKLIPEEQFRAICAAMATEIAGIESDLRRLATERTRAGEDLSTIQIVDERIAELRDRWERLRAEAAAFAASPTPAEAGVTTTIRSPAGD